MRHYQVGELRDLRWEVERMRPSGGNFHDLCKIALDVIDDLELAYRHNDELSGALLGTTGDRGLGCDG